MFVSSKLFWTEIVYPELGIYHEAPVTGGTHTAHRIFVITAIDQSHGKNGPTNLKNTRQEQNRWRLLSDLMLDLRLKDRWLRAVLKTSFGCRLGTVREFCPVSVVALLSWGNGKILLRLVNGRCNKNKSKLVKKKKKSNKAPFQLWLVSVTMINDSAIHYAKTRLLTGNFRIWFSDLQRGPPSYL